MPKVTELSHDRLLSECFLWLWNVHSETRYTCFHVRNENKELSADKIRLLLNLFLRFTGLSAAIEPFIKYYNRHPAVIKQGAISGSLDKATGIVSGVYDLEWFWNGKLYCFDIKVGSDRLSDAQKAFASAIEAQGGKCYEIRSLDEFKVIAESVLMKTT